MLMLDLRFAPNANYKRNNGLSTLVKRSQPIFTYLMNLIKQQSDNAKNSFFLISNFIYGLIVLQEFQVYNMY